MKTELENRREKEIYLRTMLLVLVSVGSAAAQLARSLGVAKTLESHLPLYNFS